MKEFKGTKGPWVVENNGYFIEIREEHGHGQIADTCSSGHHFDDGDCIEGKITIANSNLIAAAPELLHALEMVLLFCKPTQGNAAALSNAHAAIAKALGQSK